VKEIIDFFNHPFFIVVGGLATLFTAVAIMFTVFLIIKGVFPVLYRLGIGLSKRKVTIFAEGEFENFKSMLVDSKLFLEKNIIKIDKKSLKKAESSTLLLVHWKCFAADMEDIIKIKKDNAALIIYAPQVEGFIDKNILEKINLERNSIVVNLRGRLLNDILTCMITTGCNGVAS
jgi:hypothetical protein